MPGNIRDFRSGVQGQKKLPYRHYRIIVAAIAPAQNSFGAGFVAVLSGKITQPDPIPVRYTLPVSGASGRAISPLRAV